MNKQKLLELAGNLKIEKNIIKLTSKLLTFGYTKIYNGNTKIKEVKLGTKKIGRPTSSPKVNNTRIRLSDNDIQKLAFCKTQTGMTYADIIRKGIDKVYQELKK